MKHLDAKFYGKLYKQKDGSVVPPDEYCVLLAKDNATVPTLEFYLNECLRQGCGEAQLNSVARMIERAKEWRAANPHRCKNADIQPGESVLE